MKAGFLRFVERDPLGWPLALAVVICAIAGVWRSFGPLLDAWGQPEYSHAWLILPLAMLVFVYRFPAVRLSNHRLPGVLVAVFSIIVVLFGWVVGSYTVAVDGAILGLIGFVWSSVGTNGMRIVGAPLVYLFFLVPIPLVLQLSISTDMQLLSSKLGMNLISIFSVPATRDGNIIVLPSTKLEVVAACSGLRYLFPLVSFAFLVSMMLEDRLWKKALIVLSSVPIAIVMNAGRIAMIAVLLERFGIDTSSEPAHAFEGFLVFFVCILLLLIEVWFLLRVGRSRGRFVGPDVLVLDHDRLTRLLDWPLPRTAFIAAAVLLTGMTTLASLPARVEQVPQRQPLALFPMTFGDWRGTPKTLDRESLNGLDLTDYVLADYVDDHNQMGPLNFYIAYYASQRAGVRAHSPQLCIPGGGWGITNQSMVTMPWPGGEPIEVNRVVIEKAGVRQIVYYWFEERGRHIATEGALKYYALKDALLDNRSDGALVRIVAPFNADNEPLGDSIMQKLVADVSVLLPSYVPGRAPR